MQIVTSVTKSIRQSFSLGQRSKYEALANTSFLTTARLGPEQQMNLKSHVHLLGIARTFKHTVKQTRNFWKIFRGCNWGGTEMAPFCL